MLYKNTNKVEITKKELERLNKYFEIDFEDVDDDGNCLQQELIDELCAKKDDSLGLFIFKFENGAVITMSMASGSSNYYDNNCFVLDDEEIWFDCDYLFDETMEFVIGEDTYICKLTIIN